MTGQEGESSGSDQLGIRADIRPPHVVVVAAVPEERRRGRIEAQGLESLVATADIFSGGTPGYLGSDVASVLLERAAELLDALTEHPGLPVTVQRKPLAKATVTEMLQKLIGVGGPSHIAVHDLLTQVGGVKFLHDMFCYPWIDGGEAAATLFWSFEAPVTVEHSDHERELNKSVDSNAVVRYIAPSGTGQPRSSEFLERNTEVCRIATDVLAEYDDARLDALPTRLAQELARIVIRDQRGIDARLNISLSRR
ncbi:TPR repeat region-containing protein [Mycobacteroides abscessus]|uniref:TPR repeat region-containing protein n=1 Tax=Mycobacteroides abscessus TaxID=36809 RepID=UPI0009A5E709|nr:hypothetical protein [Mycobacteroides abscessus]